MRKIFVIVVYDISSKRVSRVMKICRKYLIPVQKSVFDGVITEAKLKQMKVELEKIIVPEQDSICIYKMESLKYTSMEQIGLCRKVDNIF